MFSCSQTPQIEILCASKTNLKFNFLKQFKSTLYFVSMSCEVVWTKT